ncbi:MAG: hypothetical protein JWP37_346 [Mucilaginibacter sp.]|nr:hypothetical protein [Mucilaginibacter sp.]
MESNQRSRQKKASARPAGSYAFFCAPHSAKAKPSFPPYTRPAFLSAPRSFCFKVSNQLSSYCQQTSFGRNQAKGTIIKTHFFSPVSNQLQPKSAKTMQATSAGKGIANFAEVKPWANAVGQKIAAVVLTDLQGKGHERKEAFC